MSATPDTQTYPLGFLDLCLNPETGHAVGGLAVTDNTGFPLEFHITTAVKPTLAQRALYGRRLESFVAVDLCATELLKQIKTPLRAVLIRNPVFFGAGKLTPLPILQLEKQAQGPALKPHPDHPDHARLLDPASLNLDMVEVFSRIEQCRAALARDNDSYAI